MLHLIACLNHENLENLKTYLNIDPKDMMTAVTVTSYKLLDQNSSEKLSICEYAKFRNNLKLETFIIHRLRASRVDGHRNYTTPAGREVVRNKTGLFNGLRVETIWRRNWMSLSHVSL